MTKYGLRHGPLRSELRRGATDRPLNHFVDGTECRLAVAKIEHAIERSKQRIEFVGAEQDRDLGSRKPCASHRGDILDARVETDQRLVQQQHAGCRSGPGPATAVDARRPTIRPTAARQDRARRQFERPVDCPALLATSEGKPKRSPFNERRQNPTCSAPARASGSALGM